MTPRADEREGMRLHQYLHRYRTFCVAQRRGIPVNHSKCLFAHGRRGRGFGNYDRPITVSDTGGGIDGPKAA
jgi:hypothetical protein